MDGLYKTNAPIHKGLASIHNGSDIEFGFPITGVPLIKSNISHSHKMGYPL